MYGIKCNMIGHFSRHVAMLRPPGPAEMALHTRRNLLDTRVTYLPMVGLETVEHHGQLNQVNRPEWRPSRRHDYKRIRRHNIRPRRG